jgi:hypothetical protein
MLLICPGQMRNQASPEMGRHPTGDAGLVSWLVVICYLRFCGNSLQIPGTGNLSSSLKRQAGFRPPGDVSALIHDPETDTRNCDDGELGDKPFQECLLESTAGLPRLRGISISIPLASVMWILFVLLLAFPPTSSA